MPVLQPKKHYRESPTAVDLCITTPDVSPDTDNAAVLQLFNKHKELVSLPVVENERPFGLINRHIFLSQMSRPFYRELYDKKSCIAFMDKNPLIVDATASLNAVADQTVISGDKSLTDGFIITQNGAYLGIGLGIDVINGVLTQRQASLIVLDIDHFKRVNDTFGRPTGDAVTCSLITRVREALEGTGSIGRVGGKSLLSCWIMSLSGRQWPMHSTSISH